MYKTKAEVVKQLSFVKDIYSKIKNAGFYKNGEKYDLCGVVFISHWAFATNNHFLIRVHIPDRPPKDVIYYDLKDDDVADNPLDGVTVKDTLTTNQSVFYNYQNNSWEKGVIEDLNNISIRDFQRAITWKENFAIFNKKELITRFKEIFGRSTVEKVKRCCVMQQCPDQGIIKCKIMRTDKPEPDKDKEFSLQLIEPTQPTFLSSGYIPPSIAIVNCFYLYEFLNSRCFEKSDYIYMSYDNAPTPINLQSYMYESGEIDREIIVSIARAVVRYDYEI